jgi:hypothetical protein
MEEYNDYLADMKKLEAAGKIRIEPNGIIINTGLTPGGKEIPFTGDHDLFDVRFKDGTKVPREVYQQVIADLKAADCGVQHGSVTGWELDAPSTFNTPAGQQSYGKMVGDHSTGGKEPLVRIGDGEPTATWYQPAHQPPTGTAPAITDQDIDDWAAGFDQRVIAPEPGAGPVGGGATPTGGPDVTPTGGPDVTPTGAPDVGGPDARTATGTGDPAAVTPATIDADGATARAGTSPELQPHEVAHQGLLDRLHQGMVDPIPPAAPTADPIPSGEAGRFTDPDAAYAKFRDAVSRAGDREVGLFFDRATGTYAVVVGGRASVAPPGAGWECPIHTHPNTENILTYRMPAPQDVMLSFQETMRTGRTSTSYIEYPLPEGGRGQCRLTIDPDGSITFEYPGQVGGPEHLTFGEYTDRWGSRTRYVEPGTREHRQFLADMDQAYRNMELDRTRSGAMPAGSDPAGGGVMGQVDAALADPTLDPLIRGRVIRELEQFREEHGEAASTASAEALEALERRLCEILGI